MSELLFMIRSSHLCVELGFEQTSGDQREKVITKLKKDFSIASKVVKFNKVRLIIDQGSRGGSNE